MSAETQTAAVQAEQSSCWCCGRAFPDDALVHLGSHPEVSICINCIHVLRRHARDHQATVIRRRLRGAAEKARGEVMARGWHRHPVAGSALRWLNQHLPW